MTPDGAGAARRLWRGFQRGRRRFRRWRRGRPFWGGVFLMLGGGNLYLSTQLSPLDVEISFGPEGFLAVLLPAVLLLCGILLWATPQHRYFYSIIGTLTAVYSLLGLNLGGWFLGMLFGIIGGALGFAWTPVTAPPPAEPSPAEPVTAELPPVEPDPRTDDQAGPRTHLAVVVPLLLAAVLAHPAPQPLPAQLPCLPLLCQDETPTPDPEPSPSPSPPAEPGDPEPTPTPAPTPTPLPELDPPAGQALVAAEPALLTADRVEDQNFLFEGVTTLPTADGPIEVLQFSFTRSVATNFTLAPDAGGATTQITADPLVISGDVTLYTSRFRGRLLGVTPLDLTPDSPEADLLQLVDIPLPVFFTDVDLDLVFTHGAELTGTGFALRVVTAG